MSRDGDVFDADTWRCLRCLNEEQITNAEQERSPIGGAVRSATSLAQKQMISKSLAIIPCKTFPTTHDSTFPSDPGHDDGEQYHSRSYVFVHLQKMQSTDAHYFIIIIIIIIIVYRPFSMLCTGWTVLNHHYQRSESCFKCVTRGIDNF